MLSDAERYLWERHRNLERMAAELVDLINAIEQVEWFHEMSPEERRGDFYDWLQDYGEVREDLQRIVDSVARWDTACADVGRSILRKGPVPTAETPSSPHAEAEKHFPVILVSEQWVTWEERQEIHEQMEAERERKRIADLPKWIPPIPPDAVPPSAGLFLEDDQ